MDVADVDGNGTLDYGEFVAATVHTDGSGYIENSWTIPLPGVLPGQPSLLSNNRQSGNGMPLPRVLPGQPSLFSNSRQSGNGMPLPCVLPRQPRLLNNNMQSGNDMPLPGVLPG
ncbi:unnamed protein product [Sphagnum jensenii]|uniref:EF-hand domain-containing protein n=1 Tax=Sphagnum jensenii TaxID=128206 RepID=A0ABP1A8F5_9BRYO